MLVAVAPLPLQCAISNHRERIGRLASACEELAKHGPAKPEAERGLDEVRTRGARLHEGNRVGQHISACI